SKWRRAMSNRAAAIGNQCQIGLGPPADPGVAIQKQRVAKDGVGTKYADLMRPLDRRLAVAPEHLLYFIDALGNMHGERNAALTRRLVAGTQKIGRAILDLHWRDNAGQAPAWMPRRPVDQRQCCRKAIPPPSLVPGEFQLEIVFEVPARGGVAG